MLGNQIVYVGGDILMAVDDVAIESNDQLESLLEDKYQVGNPVRVTFLREGVKMEVTVNLAEEPN